MTSLPSEPETERSQPSGSPLEDADAARRVAHLTGMTPEAAAAFAAYHSGRFVRRD
jgi:hypothetical protein